MLCLGKFTILLYIHTVIYLLVNDNENYICQGNALFMTLFLTFSYRYQYDGNGRLAVLLSSIGAGNDHQHTDTFTYNAHTGKLEAVSGLRLTNLAINKTILTDSEDNFYKTIEYDGLGRISG